MSARPSLKALCMSGYAEGSSLLPGLREMGIGLIQKPFDAAVLLAEIRRTLDANGKEFKEA